MKQLTLPDVYRLMNEAVRFYSPSNPVERPNTFAVLESEKDFTNASLGYDEKVKDKPHYFSRYWEDRGFNPSDQDWKYPAVFVFEMNMEHENILRDGKHKKWNLSLNVLVKDWDEKRDDFGYSSQHETYKTPSEYYLDAESILISVYKFFEKCVLATTSNDSTKRIYNKDYLIWQEDNDSDFSYYIFENESRAIIAELSKHNKNRVFKRNYLEAQKAVCVFTELVIPNNCDTDHFTYDYYAKPSEKYDQPSDPSAIIPVLVDSDDEPVGG